MYAIVKTGGKQYKVAVGDVVTVEKLVGEPGASIALPAILLVDGEEVTTDAAALAKVSVTGEIVGAGQGSEDPDPQVQEQDRLPQADRAPAEAVADQGHRHRERKEVAPWHTRRVHRPPVTGGTRTPSGSA